jgi:hypothetical protein
VYEFPRGYIVHNTLKEFEDGHSHLRAHGTAMYVVRLLVRKKLPNDTPRYLLISLIRLSADLDYIEKAKSLFYVKYGQHYYKHRGGRNVQSNCKYPKKSTKGKKSRVTKKKK